MSRALNRLGRLAARRPWAVIGAWIAVSVLVVGASAGFGRELSDSLAVPGLDSQRAADLQERAGTGLDGITAQVVMTPRDREMTVDGSPRLRAAVAGVESRIAALPHVIRTSGDTSADERVLVLRVQYPTPGELSVEDLDRLKEVVASETSDPASPLRIEAGGALFFVFEEPAPGIVELVGLVVAAVVLLVAFGSVIAMGLPIVMAVLGIAVGFSALSLITLAVDIPSWSTVIGAMVGLGVGIDYALFLVTRHREFLARGMSVEASAGAAVATAGQAVIFAGGTVVIAILGLAVAGIPFLTTGGLAISLIVLLMVLGAVTLVPALLGLAGQRINGRRARRTSPTTSLSARWLRWGTHVSRNAWAYAVGVTVLLLAVAAPVLGLRLGFPDDGSLPESRTERRAYDLVAEGFGPGINGPLVIAVDISKDGTVVAPLAVAVKADPGIASVAPPEVDTGAGLATVLAFPTTAPQDDATFETIKRLRAEVFPEVLAGSPASAHVGGQTATWADLGAKVAERLPWFIGAVVLLSVVLLTVVFRSVVVPVKAALLNLLSTGAAFGVLVMVFQWGWGMELIGLESTIPVIPIIPMLMFAILFGISMDYEVFLLSRVREHFVRFGNSDLSVIHGLAGTARVITSAALIMISVFLGFAFGDDPSAKMMGLGLATAIFIDATIVRLVLVPATMTLLGNANWWLPAWLDRILPGTDIEDGVGPAHPSVGQRVDTANVADAASSVNDADSAERSLTP